MNPPGYAESVRVIRCDCDDAAEFTLTMLDSNSHDAASFMCWSCVRAVVDDWAENNLGHWGNVPGWTIERLQQFDGTTDG